ncbi:hypothetical protein BCR32DRAFT_213086 [Anaeromyces robustus]|uniref:Phox-like protein n=1 Tax=Anaeromyces robustus TaxID=1754192 RepID=A0A1Y1VS65_9FUNG|nr:hypothetical protein BCR32DRAFT_213086 [Anaeromyces robustus]|eukprot:ORX64107.1 hypothetical protein BCR32DRAFT_213086 [Anaeromyces robustus]
MNSPTSPIDERLFKIPPKKVIKTNQNYEAQYSQEISFKKGDFFYVINEDELYYSIVNPAEKITGLVPKIFCEALDKSVKRKTQYAEYSYNSLNRGKYRAIYNNDKNDYNNQRDQLDSSGNVYTIDSSDVPKEESFTAKVINCEPTENDRFVITLEVTKPARNKKLILTRLYDDFFAMQSILLKLFPKEAGRIERYERIIPFVPPAPHKVMPNFNNKNHMEKYREELDSYVKEMTKMPYRIQSSFPVRRFFLLRNSDSEKELSLSRYDSANSYDDGEDFLDLLSDYEESFLPLKVVFERKPYRIEISDKITFDQLWTRIEDFFNIDIMDVYFKDEEGYEIPLLNDIDLGNFLRTRKYHLLLFVE